MSKVDWVVFVVLTAFMVFCFWMGSRTWFFVAGISASVISAIGVGHWLKGTERHQQEKSWDSFLDKMQDENRLTGSNRKQNKLIKSELAVHHNMF